MPSTNDEKLLTQSEAAELLNVQPDTLNIWRSRDQGPRWIKINKKAVRYRLSDLLAYIDSCTIVPADPGPLARA